jgi:hypothetical protein
MTPKTGPPCANVTYINLNAINLIEYCLYNTQALARRAGEINGETEYSGSQEYHFIKLITHPRYLDDRPNIFALEHITPAARSAEVRAMYEYVKCSKRKRFLYSSVVI